MRLVCAIFLACTVGCPGFGQYTISTFAGGGLPVNVPGNSTSIQPLAIAVDTAGNVYCGGAGGIYILDPKGKKLGRIVHGQPATTNIGFGGDDWKTLFFTSRSHLGSVNLKIAGIPVPPPKRT